MNRIKNFFSGIGFKVGLVTFANILFAFFFSLLASLVASSLVIRDMKTSDSEEFAVALIESDDMAAATEIFEKGAGIYYSLPDEMTSDPLSDEYLSNFSGLIDDDYLALRSHLSKIVDKTKIMWIDLRLLDEDRGRFVYLLDTENRSDLTYTMGSWNPVRTEAVTNLDLSIIKENYTTDNKADKTFNPRKLEVFCTIVPYHHPQTGEILGYVGIGEKNDFLTIRLALFTGIFLALSIFFIVITLVINRKITKWMIVKPIKKLTDAAREYVAIEDKMSAEPVFSKVKLKRKDEIKVLADSMAEMEENLSTYMHDLTALTAKQERLDAELTVAESIQTGLLPKELEGYEGTGDFTINSYIKPAREVGGDFYDYFVIDDDHIGLVIADVSGKGVPAALFMAISKTIIRNAALEHTSPAIIIENANRRLCLNNPETMFVTVWFGIYTISERTVTCVNAGHEYPAVYRAESDSYELIDEDHDPVLGFMPDIVFNEHTITLNPGDRLFQYTDGVPEANGADEVLFGTDRMLECLNSTSVSDSGDAVFEALCSRIEEFTGGTEQYDDMTMLMLSV